MKRPRSAAPYGPKYVKVSQTLKPWYLSKSIPKFLSLNGSLTLINCYSNKNLCSNGIRSCCCIVSCRLLSNNNSVFETKICTNNRVFMDTFCWANKPEFLEYSLRDKQLLLGITTLKKCQWYNQGFVDLCLCKVLTF